MGDLGRSDTGLGRLAPERSGLSDAGIQAGREWESRKPATGPAVFSYA
jgi:hypothetical protein